MLRQATPFRVRGDFRLYVMGHAHGERDRYFCSELLTEALVKAGVMDADTARPAATVPRGTSSPVEQSLSGQAPDGQRRLRPAGPLAARRAEVTGPKTNAESAPSAFVFRPAPVQRGTTHVPAQRSCGDRDGHASPTAT